jgi:hypothetical protein
MSHEPVSIPDFSADGPAMSDIILFKEGVQPGGQSGGKEEGLAAALRRAETERVFRIGDEMGVLFEVYNLRLDGASGRNKVRAEYAVVQSDKVMARIPAPPIEPSAQTDCRLRTSFRLKNFQPGEYVLRATITDDNSGQAVSKRIPFSIVAPRPTGSGTQSERPKGQSAGT